MIKMKNLKSDYTYIFKDVENLKCLAIKDLNLGGTSVTNNIENIIKKISKIEKKDFSHFLVVYRDSDETWDGFNQKDSSFILLQEKDTGAAVAKLQKICRKMKGNTS